MVSGSTLSAAGDVNDDGFDDFLIGSSNEAYVVFGGDDLLSRYDAADGLMDGSLDLALIAQNPMEFDGMWV
jgi:hypothetical protein